MFSSILDQQKAVDIITGQIKSGRIPHAYLFLGQEGVGRKATALELAKSLNCTETPGDACGKCSSCRKIDSGLHPDVQLVNFAWQANLENKEVEKQRSIKIDTIRAVQKDVSLKPSEGKWKVYIIEPAEKITLDAANCLLKTLEEPPKWTVLILLARNRENLPATVVSRTQIIRFAPLKEETVTRFIVEKHGLPAAQARRAASRSGGSFSAAAALLEEGLEGVEPFWNGLKKKEVSDAEALSVSQQNSKNAADFLDELLVLAKFDFNREPERFRSAAAEILASRKLLERNINSQMVLDNLLLKLNRSLKQN